MIARWRPRISKWVAIGFFLLCILAIWTAFSIILAPEQDLENQPNNWATTPTNRESLRALQDRVQSAVRKASPSVVAIELSPHAEKREAFEVYASGVIISADGLILSQAHVSHALHWSDDGKVRQVGRQPGDRTTVILSDGRRLEAKLLGADSTFDLSLLQLLPKGPYPHVPFDPTPRMNLGDWVIKLGHPIGYRPDRPAVARLGRVLFVRNDVFVSDCYAAGGDSGGPFFDLDGQLVGILGDVTAPRHISNGLSPPDHSRVGPWTTIPNLFIHHRMAQMLRSDVIPYDHKAADKHFNGSHSYRWATDGVLPRKQWTQGRATVNAFHDVIQDARRSVVTILDDTDHVVAHGTIVSADGEIVTLASTLPKTPRCRISNAQQVHAAPAQIVGTDAAFDLALLKVPVNGLPPVKWKKGPPPEAGTLLGSVGIADTALGIGIVSVSQRDLPGPFCTSVMRCIPYAPRVNPRDPAAHTYAERPAVYGRPGSKGYLVDMAAPDTELEPGDWIVSVGGRNIGGDGDLVSSCARLSPSEKVLVCLIRNGQKIQLNANLFAVPMRGFKDYAEFPTVFEHDMPLFMSPFGSPVVDLDGDAIGITVYRSTYGCLAIPGDCIMRLLPKLQDKKSKVR